MDDNETPTGEAPKSTGSVILDKMAYGACYCIAWLVGTIWTHNDK